jgi:hypothetical protein
MRALVCDLSMPRQIVSAVLGRVDRRLFPHRFPLDRYVDAFMVCGEQGTSGAVKVLFDYGNGRPGANGS